MICRFDSWININPSIFSVPSCRLSHPLNQLLFLQTIHHPVERSVVDRKCF